MIQALTAAVFAGVMLVSGLIGTQSLRDHFAYRDLNKSTAADLQRVNSQRTTPSENVKEPDFFPPAPSGDSATATPVAVSNEPISDTLSAPAGSVLGESTEPAATRPVIETVRIVETGANTAYIDARIAVLSQSLLAQLGAVGAASQYGDENIYRSVGMVAEEANEPLTDADVPDTITASNYLPLSGGTLTGTLTGTDLTLSGTLTAGALSVAGISSSGALIGPYVTATSTTASTFGGALAIGTTTAATQLSIQQSGSNNLQDWYDATGVKQADIRLQGTGAVVVAVLPSIWPT